uniref:C2H2-type domain-containing protein n=1 Tax=Stomoxys calcitrans TaxID=35570 RepID=A0A1I8P0Q2_STOCA
MSEKKCRLCLKTIDDQTTFTDLTEVPNPMVYLQNGITASSYLQCYHFCLQFDITNSIINLPDYPYICGMCKSKMLETVNFIVRSQRNEGYLMSLYDIGKDESSISEDIAEDLLEDLGVIHSDEEQSAIETQDYIIEEEEIEDEQEIVENEFPQANIYELQNTLVGENIGIECKTVDGDKEGRNDDNISLENTISENTQENDTSQWERSNELEETTNFFNDLSQEEPPKRRATDNDNRKWKAVPKEIFNLDFKCLLCRKSFKLQRKLYEHYDSEHDQISLAFPCDVCSRRHISQKALTFHKHNIHNSIKHEDCNLCGQAILPAFFKSHKNRHKNAVLYACCKCDRRFDRLCTVKQHHRAVHEKDKVRRYECQDCERHFFSEEKLEKHRIVHEQIGAVSEIDFLCHICSKTFVRKIDLQLHLKVHNGNIIKCPHCVKEFVRPKDMEYHMRYHTKDHPFKCNICSRGFAVRWSYDAHMKQHEGVRYKCEICDKEYIHLSALRVHTYEHRGFPFSCKMCSKGFSIRKKARLHLKSKHLKSYEEQHYTDAMLDEYIVRNRIPHLYVKGECVDDDSDMKEDN